MRVAVVVFAVVDKRRKAVDFVVVERDIVRRRAEGELPTCVN